MLPQMFNFAMPDGFRLLHVVIAVVAFGWALALVPTFISRGKRLGFVLPALVTLAATVGIFTASSLFTLFVCFEVMSVVSYLLVIQPANDKARRAGGTYLAVAIVGGMSMLMGMLLIYTATGSLELATLPTADSTTLAVAGLLLLVGFGAKAGMFPLHIWLPASYTQAPYPGTLVLSSALSKAGTFGIVLLGCTLFAGSARWGMLILVLGLITMLLGGILAVASPGLKTTLAYSSMSQIGFILSGIGMAGLLGEHNTIAARGIVLHTMNHSLVKLVLFTVAAVICHSFATQRLARLHGAGRGKPLLAIATMFAGGAIAGIPGLSGYVSKTLLHESIVEYIHLLPTGSDVMVMRGFEAVFLFSGGLTLAYIGKLYYILFVLKPDADTAPAVAPASRLWSVCAMVATLPLSLMGIAPAATMDRLADMTQGFVNPHLPAHPVPYMAWANLQGAVISVGIGAVVFVLAVLLPQLRGSNVKPKRPAPSLLDWLYTPVFYYILPVTLAVVARLLDNLCLAPLRWLTNRPARTDKVYPKLNFSFGSYTEQSVSEGYFSKYLPSSLKYSLITFSAGLLLAIGYLIFFS